MLFITVLQRDLAYQIERKEKKGKVSVVLALYKGNWELKRHAASRKSQALQTRIRRRHKSNPRD